MAEFQLTITDILLDSSKLVPDALLIDIIKDRLARDGVLSGWMLDGFPRTMPQAEGCASARDLPRTVQ